MNQSIIMHSMMEENMDRSLLEFCERANKQSKKYGNHNFSEILVLTIISALFFCLGSNLKTLIDIWSLSIFLISISTVVIWIYGNILMIHLTIQIIKELSWPGCSIFLPDIQLWWSTCFWTKVSLLKYFLPPNTLCLDLEELMLWILPRLVKFSSSILWIFQENLPSSYFLPIKLFHYTESS